MTQLVADEQEALKELVKSCCSKQALGGGSDLASGEAGSWCSSVGRAVTYDLRQWYSDICHVAPNVCDKDGHLRRLVLPPYALRCSSFPQVMRGPAHSPCLRALLLVACHLQDKHVPLPACPTSFTFCGMSQYKML